MHEVQFHVKRSNVRYSLCCCFTIFHVSRPPPLLYGLSFVGPAFSVPQLYAISRIVRANVGAFCNQHAGGQFVANVG